MRNELQAKFEELERLQTTLSREDFEKKIQSELFPLIRKEMAAHGCFEPDWAPLEKIMPMKWCAGFMFMGYEGEIRIYKHAHTRHCLYVDPQGNTYERIGDGFARLDPIAAIDEVFEGLDAFGFTRSTPADEKHIALRHKIIKERTGVDIVTVTPKPHP